MPRIHRSRRNRLPLIIGIALVIIIGAVWGLRYSKQSQQQSLPSPPIEEKRVHGQVKNQPVIDYQRLKKDENLNAMMEQRKSEYGMDKGVDLIVKPDESLKIGDETVSMQEILDRIRLKKGDIVEKDIGDAIDIEKRMQDRNDRIRELAGMEERALELEKSIAESGGKSAPKTLADEQAGLMPTVSAFRKYNQTLSAIESMEKQLVDPDASKRQAARDSLQTLEMQQRQLERSLKIPALPRPSKEIYGIHIVRKGDNIWNIHFQFLKDYFTNRGIDLAPMADEPDKKGFSSGVGKLLKFSENMVYIFNLKERKLDVNLNLLQPLSKIVVFNMGEVFALLDPIDYEQVGRVQFDGETLWIPAEQ